MDPGWDNTAFLVNDGWIARFPRRAIAAPLLAVEAAVMPAVAPRLPLAVPAPELHDGDGRFRWPFALHRLVPGEPAFRSLTDDEARAARFETAYGPLDDETRRLARFRAVHVGATVALWGHDIGDDGLVAEGRWALRGVLA